MHAYSMVHCTGNEPPTYPHRITISAGIFPHIHRTNNHNSLEPHSNSHIISQQDFAWLCTFAGSSAALHDHDTIGTTHPSIRRAIIQILTSVLLPVLVSSDALDARNDGVRKNYANTHMQMNKTWKIWIKSRVFSRIRVQNICSNAAAVGMLVF